MSARRQRSITLAEIARVTGFSAAAVSYALRDHPKIPAATRKSIQILRAQSITGVVFSPLVHSQQVVSLDWRWEEFAGVSMGGMAWSPELHRAGHHHFDSVRMVMLELATNGARRPAALFSEEVNERTKRACEGSFLAHHPTGAAEAVKLLRLSNNPSQKASAEWLLKSGADALLISYTQLWDRAGLRKLCRSLKLPVASLHWNGDMQDLVGAIDQCEERIASRAVEMVVSLLHLNDIGLPLHPSVWHFPGSWLAAGQEVMAPIRRGTVPKHAEP